MDIILKNKTPKVEVTLPTATELIVTQIVADIGVEVPGPGLGKPLLANSEVRDTLSTSCELTRDQAGKITKIIHADGTVDIAYDGDGRLSSILKNGRTIRILRDQYGRIYGIGVN